MTAFRGNVLNKPVINMKKLFFVFLISNLYVAQVGVETTTVRGSGILDFATGTTKGIILPNVINNTTMTNVTPGTIVYDLITARIKYYDGAWKDLTYQNGTAPNVLAGNDVATKAGVIVGDPASTAEGVLVLESPNKALILPQINNPVLNVKSPVAGMICYDPTTKLMCIFNGKDWYFFK